MATAFVFKRPFICYITFGGPYKVTGIVDKLGQVGQYKVRLYDRQTGYLIQQVWSNPDGSYEFTGLNNRPNAYMTIGIDDTGSPVNAAVCDYITPEHM